MAVALVQSPATANTGGSSFTATATLTNPPGVGNLLLCLVSYSNFGGGFLSTPAGWAKPYDNTGTVSPFNNAVFSKISAGAGDQSLTVTYSRSDGMTLWFVELSGATNSLTHVAQANSSSTPAGSRTSNDLCLAMGCTNGGSVGGASANWVETYIGGVPFHQGDFQYYTGASLTPATVMTGFSSTVIFTIPAPGSIPGAFVSQTIVEPLGIDPRNARLSQTVVEPLGIDPRNARVSQTVVEPLGIDPRNARLTQTIVEPMGINPRTGRLTQTIVEFLYLPLFLTTGQPLTDDEMFCLF